MEMDGTPIRDSSKVLECGLLYFIIWRRRKKTELSHPVGDIWIVRQEVSALPARSRFGEGRSKTFSASLTGVPWGRFYKALKCYKKRKALYSCEI
jgi:hypothetical protein